MNISLKQPHDISRPQPGWARRLRRMLLLGWGLVLLVACSALPAKARYASTHPPKEETKRSVQELTPMEQLKAVVSSVIAQGERLLGRRYRTRGVAPWPLDCSGYVSYLYRKQGMSIPRSSAALSAFAHRVDDPQPGDLVFFKGRNASSSRVGHVALVVENNDGDLVIMHSTNSRGIIKHRLNSDQYFRSRYLFVGRIPQVSELWRQHREAGGNPRHAPLKPQDDQGRVVPAFAPESFTFALLMPPLLAHQGDR